MSNKSEIYNNTGVAINNNEGEIHYHQGLTLEEIKPYIAEIARNELGKYKFEALETAQNRDSEFIVSVFNKLNQLDTKIEKVKEALSSPSMQFDLLEAERGYIKTGSKQLLDILGELIAERVNCTEATIKQIVLSEAVKTAPILLDKQLDILALRFLLTRTLFPGTRTFDQLRSFLSNIILPFCSKVDLITQLDFDHLDFTRCSIKGVFSSHLCSYLWKNYTSAFYQPFAATIAEMERINGKTLKEWYPEVFVGIGNDSLSFSMNNYSEFLDILNRDNDIPEPVKNRMISFYKEHCLAEEKCVDYLFEKAPELKPLGKMWNSGVSYIKLSSIGLTIGAIHAKNNINRNIDVNIDDWIH